MSISRRTLLRGLAGAAAAPTLASATVKKGPRAFRFVYMTDLHIQPELGAADGVAMAIRRINSLTPRPDFVITGGDLIFDSIEVPKSRAGRLYTVLTETFKALEMPVHHTIGNHDCFGYSSRNRLASMDPLYGKKMFEDRLRSKPYRSFNFRGWHFVILDSIQLGPRGDWFGGVDAEQLEWVKNDLRVLTPGTPIIVSIHVPVLSLFMQYYMGTTLPNVDRMICRNGKQIHEILNGFGVRMVLQGHTHVVEQCQYLGTQYLSCGSVSGEWWQGPRLGKHPEGFMVFDVDGERVRRNYVSYGWKAQT